MNKSLFNLVGSGVIALGLSGTSQAQEPTQLDHIERQLHQLELRVDELSANQGLVPAPQYDDSGWKSEIVPSQYPSVQRSSSVQKQPPVLSNPLPPAAYCVPPQQPVIFFQPVIPLQQVYVPPRFCLFNIFKPKPRVYIPVQVPVFVAPVAPSFPPVFYA